LRGLAAGAGEAEGSPDKAGEPLGAWFAQPRRHSFAVSPRGSVPPGGFAPPGPTQVGPGGMGRPVGPPPIVAVKDEEDGAALRPPEVAPGVAVSAAQAPGTKVGLPCD
jgi:hypothetical protein